MRIKTIRKAVGIILSASLIASAFPVYAEETQTPSSYSIEAEEEAATLDQLGTEEDIQDELEIKNRNRGSCSGFDGSTR